MCYINQREMFCFGMQGGDPGAFYKFLKGVDSAQSSEKNAGIRLASVVELEKRIMGFGRFCVAFLFDRDWFQLYAQSGYGDPLRAHGRGICRRRLALCFSPQSTAFAGGLRCTYRMDRQM